MSLGMNFPLSEDLLDKNYASLYQIRYGQRPGGTEYIFEPGLLGNAFYIQGTTTLAIQRYERLGTGNLGGWTYEFGFPDEFSGSMGIKPKTMNSSGMVLGALNDNLNGGSDGNFPVGITSTGRVKAGIIGVKSSSSKTYTYCETDADDVAANKGTHIAFVYKQNAIALYVNGEKKATADCPSNLYTLTETYMWFGERLDSITMSIGSFTGGVSNFCFSTSGWSDADVKELSKPLLAKYPLRYGEYYRQNPTSESNKIIWPGMTDCHISGKKYNSGSRYASIYASTRDFNQGLYSTFTGRHLKTLYGSPSGSCPTIFTNLDHLERSISFGFNTAVGQYPSGVLCTLPSLNSTSGSNRFIQIGAYSSDEMALGGWSGEKGVFERDYFDTSLATVETLNPTASPNLKTMRLFTFTFDGTYMRIYIDTQLAGEFYNPYSDFSGIYFSHYTGTTNYTGFFGSPYFSGSISDIQIFAKALSQEDITEIFNQGVKFCPSGQCRAAEFIETASQKEVNIYPKGVVYCSDIQEDASVDNPQLLPNGVLKVKEIIEE